MADVKMASNLPVSAEELWKMVGGWNALADWHPAIEKSELEDGGTVRRLHLVGGGEIVETLTNHDNNGRTYAYEIKSGPLPVADYKATITVLDEEDGGAKIEWSSAFQPSGASENDAVKTIQDIYQTGFDNLKKMFGG